jgi:hypothetical protein
LEGGILTRWVFLYLQGQEFIRPTNAKISSLKAGFQDF